MKKSKIITSALFIAFSLGVVGCSDTSSPSSNPSASTSESWGDPTELTAEITFWHTMGKKNADLLTSLISSFNRTYPNITVRASQAAGGYPDLRDMILQAIPANTTPTMAFCYPDHVAEYLGSQVMPLVNVEKFISDPDVGFTMQDGSHKNDQEEDVYGVADYVESFWNEGTDYTNEGIYSVPFAKSTEALFYNKDVFDDNGWTVPTTWDEMWDLCRTIRQAYPETDPDTGDYLVYPLGYDSDSNFLITLFEQNGVAYTSKSGEHYLFNTPEAKAIVNDLKAKHDEGLFVTKGSLPNSTYTSTKFTAEEIFMSIGSTGGTTYQDTNNFEVGVAVPPATDLNNPKVVSQGPSICFFNNATATQQRAAWLFYKFISNAENNTRYSVTTGYQPVRTSSYETQIFQEFMSARSGRSLLNDVAEVSAGMLDSYFSTAVFKGSANARDQIGVLLKSVLLGSKTVDDAFRDAYTACING